MKPATCLLLACLTAASLPVVAQDIVAIDRGWYDSDGFHDPDNPNYIAGEFLDRSIAHNFFVFDLAGVSEEITNAGLRLFVPENGFVTDEGFETYSLFEVTSEIDALIAGAGGTEAHADLAGGVLYGELTATGRDRGATITLPLNADAIEALNARRGERIAFGGALDATAPELPGEFLFGNSGSLPSDTRLVLETNAPASVGITVAGVVTLAGICENLTNAQRVTIAGEGAPPVTTLDCEAAGLHASSGDEVRITARAFVFPQDPGRFNGTAEGFTVADPVQCANRTLGERLNWVTIGAVWDCERAGLSLNGREIVQVTLRGTVD
ncbi:MAG: hypothetical protein AAF184_10405 [Pseudomonadota bacterium]